MTRRLLIVALLALAGGSAALAQQAPAPRPATSELMVSWRSNGYAPPGYGGRVAAAGGGTVLLQAEMLVGGRPASLAPYEIRWFLNGELYEGGIGLTAVQIGIDTYHQDSMDIRVEVINAPFTSTVGNLSVPLTDARAVVEPRTAGTLRAGENVFAAIPYSFNVTNPNDLVYLWTVNGEVPQNTDDPRTLTVTLDGEPAGPLDVGLLVSHPQRAQEVAQGGIRMSPAP